MMRRCAPRLLRCLQNRQLTACLDLSGAGTESVARLCTPVEAVTRRATHPFASGSSVVWQLAQPCASYSTRGARKAGKPGDAPVEEAAAEAAGALGAAAAEQEAAAAQGGESPSGASVDSAGEQDDVEGALSAELQAALAAKDKEVRDMRERNLRVLADMENLRERSAKAAQSTKQYAIQGFVKDLVEVADNLQRAAETVPGAVLEGKDADGQPLSPERALALLQSLLQGVHLTERQLQQALRKHGVERYMPKEGDAFDHDMHNAMFDVPLPPNSGDTGPGSIAMLIKNGYTLNGRVVRPADVATFRGPA